MTRFVTPNLAALGPLPLDAVSYERLRLKRIEYFTAALATDGIAYDVGMIESDPAVITVARGGGYGEMLLRQRINEAIRSISLSEALGPALDHIGATYYGISRAAGEADDRFRARIALAPEAFSTAGPEGAYIFHAVELDGIEDVADVAVYSEEDGATYTAGLYADAWSAGARPAPFAGRANGNPVLAPEILAVVLPALAYGAADQALLDRVYRAVAASDVRPIGDNVRIEPAEVVTYAVDMTITFARGADPTPIVAEARRRLEAYVAARRRVGVTAQILGLGGCGYVTGVEAVSLAAPLADVAGGAKQAPQCTAIILTTVQSEGSWT